MKLGVYAQNQQDRFQAAIVAAGGAVTWQRIYYQQQAWSSMPLVASRAAAGYKVMFSWRPVGAQDGSTWDAIATGSEDARLTAIGNGLAGIPNAGIWCFNHEPENDPPNGLKGSASRGAAFVAAWERCYSIIKPLAPNWRGCINLFEEVFPSYEPNRGSNWAANPDPHNWMSPMMDVLGVDYYWWRGWNFGSPTPWATTDVLQNYDEAITEFLAYADFYGVPFNFPEFGATVRDPALVSGDDARRAAWFQSVATDWSTDPRIESCMYFEVNNEENISYPNWSITDTNAPPMDPATVAAFVAFDGTIEGYVDTYSDGYAGAAVFNEFQAQVALSATASIASVPNRRFAWSASASATTAAPGSFQRQADLTATANIISTSRTVKARSVAMFATATIDTTVIGGSITPADFGLFEMIVLPDGIDASMRPQAFVLAARGGSLDATVRPVWFTETDFERD